MPHFIVLKQGSTPTSWDQINDEAVEAKTRDAAIDQERTTAGTFVAVLVDGFRPRTHYAPPKPVAPKQQGGTS